MSLGIYSIAMVIEKHLSTGTFMKHFKGGKNMNKRWLSILMAAGLVAAMPVAVMADDAAEEPQAVTTVGPEDGTHFEMWSFVDAHNEFYGQMVEKWNEENPDKPINVTFSTYPYSDMHNKLMMSLQAGSGAPDMCDVEIGQFPNYTGDDCPLVPLNDALADSHDQPDHAQNHCQNNPVSANPPKE